MSPVEAVKHVLRNYVTFSGRARRSEYWWFFLFSALVALVASILDMTFFGTETLQLGRATLAQSETGPIGLVVPLLLFLPALAVAVRRLHDTDRSGWWILIGLIPIVGTIILIVFYAIDSKPDNRFGPRPKPLSAY